MCFFSPLFDILTFWEFNAKSALCGQLSIKFNISLFETLQVLLSRSGDAPRSPWSKDVHVGK